MLATVSREMGLKRLINPKPQREDKFKRWNAAKQTVDGAAQVKASEKTRRRKKEKKRLRDKLLRDPEVGQTVLELRKKGAFINYTYRGPRFAMPEMSDRAGRASLARQSAIPVTT